MASPRDRKRKDGTTAYAAIYRHAGKQQSQTFNTRQARDRWIKLANIEGIDYALTFLQGTTSNAPTLADYARRTVQLRVNLTGGTRRGYLANINQWGPLGDMPIDLVTTQHVRTWVKQLQDSGCSMKTLRNKEGFLSSVFNDAVRDSTCPVTENPCVAVQLPNDGVKREMVFLTPTEFHRFITCIPAHYRPFVTCLFSMGLRFGEATALTIADWVPHRGAVNVNKTWKLDGHYREIVGPPKTRRGRRMVAIPAQLADYVADRATVADQGMPLFPNQHGAWIRHAKFYQQVWRPALRVANGEMVSVSGRRTMWEGVAPLDPALGKWPRIHDARHSCASWLLASGASLMDVQYTLGHESIQTTADRYGHLMPGRVEAVGVAVSRMLGGEE